MSGGHESRGGVLYHAPRSIRPSFVLGALGVLCVFAGLILTACAPTTVITAQAPPRPTIIVVTAAGPYYTTFDEPRDWLVGESAQSSGRIEEGRYLLTISEPGQLAWASQPLAFGEGVYELEATLISGPEASGFGLLMLGSGDVGSFIYVMITGDGRYDIGYCQGGCTTQQSLIGGWTIAEAIRTDYQTNFLRVELIGGTLAFTANGVLVSQLDGMSYTTGLVGVVGESAQYAGFVAAFDNLAVVETAYLNSP